MRRSLALLVPLAALLIQPACHRESAPLPPPQAPQAGPAAPASVVPMLGPAPAASSDPPPDAPPAAPVVDAAADRAAHLARARARLGDRTSIEMVDDVFLLAGPKTVSPFAKRALAAWYNGRFRTRPVRVVSVYVFPSAGPYQAHCQATTSRPCPSVYGFYTPDERTIALDAGPGLGTLTHELVHPLVEADFPDAPTWINEGIASLFEAPVMPREGEIHGARNWRLPALKAALASRDERAHARLPLLFGMSDETFRDERESLHYAMARYLCQWLDERDLLWDFYHRFRDGFAQDRTGRAAFRAATGMTPEEAQPLWEKWL